MKPPSCPTGHFLRVSHGTAARPWRIVRQRASTARPAPSEAGSAGVSAQEPFACPRCFRNGALIIVEEVMSRITALLIGIAALTVISTTAKAADGCGRGWYYNGRRCVPMDEPRYFRPKYRGDYYGPQSRGDYYGPPVRERSTRVWVRPDRRPPDRAEGAIK
jgi:hypothetical protein